SRRRHTRCYRDWSPDVCSPDLTRQFRTHWARGVSLAETNDDGTLAPTAAGGAVPFAPEVAIPALLTMRETYGSHLFSTYGFRDRSEERRVGKRGGARLVRRA